MPLFSTPALAPAARVTPAAQRYYIMGAASLPAGSAFTVTDSHRYLLTEFALGFLSVAEVVEALTTDSSAAALPG